VPELPATMVFRSVQVPVLWMPPQVFEKPPLFDVIVELVIVADAWLSSIAIPPPCTTVELPSIVQLVMFRTPPLMTLIPPPSSADATQPEIVTFSRIAVAPSTQMPPPPSTPRPLRSQRLRSVAGPPVTWNTRSEALPSMVVPPPSMVRFCVMFKSPLFASSS